MGTRDPRQDAYIAKQADFARPILTALREAVHAAVPDVVETIKWGAPAFDYHGPLAQMAGFKQHVTFGLWKGPLVMGGEEKTDAMGSLGRLASLEDLPPKRTLALWLTKAAELNAAGVKTPRPVKHPKPPLEPPADLLAALKQNQPALATFEAFSPSARRDYVEWIVEAKTDATRAKRLATAVEWMAEGKRRHWKYQS